MKRSPVLAAVLLACAAPAVVRAQVVIDQQQTSVFGALTSEPAWGAQSFRPSASNVAGAGLFLRVLSSNGLSPSVANTWAGLFTIELWSDLPSVSTASRLAGGTTPFSGTVAPRTEQWADVFWTPVAVTPGASYFLVFRAFVDQSVPRNCILGNNCPLAVTSGDANRLYAGGEGYFQQTDRGPGLPATPGLGQVRGTYVAAGVDFTFREYASVDAVSVVPEPGTWLLLATGLVALGGVQLRRRRQGH